MKPKTKPNHILSLSMPAELHEALKVAAVADRRSVRSYIVVLLERALAEASDA